jgi:peptide/nickel transport system substrate-binding protein
VHALREGRFADAWDTRTAPAELAGTGPFVIRQFSPGQRIVLERNPRYFRHDEQGGQLPHLDRLILEIVPDQDGELIRLESGIVDVIQDVLRPEDFRAARRGVERGRLSMLQLGVAADADVFWFCLKPEAKNKDPRFAFVNRPEFRQAISYAINRPAFADAVFLGEAVPISGPVTPGNTRWFSAANEPAYDVQRARQLLRSIGLDDRNHDGVVEDQNGTAARFAVITQRGVSSYELGTAFLREQAASIGIQLDIVPLEFAAMVQKLVACDYDAMYMRPITTDLDPALNLDFWLSSGSGHFWNLESPMPATPWEKEIDSLMRRQAASIKSDERHALFEAAQHLLLANMPAIYFAAPRLYTAYAARVHHVKPSVLRPSVLWNADELTVSSN